MKTLIEQTYETCIEKLKMGARPQIRLTDELILEINEAWPLKDSEQALKQILCILDNSMTTTNAFDEKLLHSLRETTKPETLIFLLSAIQKQTIAHSQKTGNMFSFEFFNSFKTLLLNDDPELKEWTLRTIESLGPLSLRLKKEILEAKPTLLQRLNAHHKNSAQIIEYMEKDWKRLMGGK